MFATLSDRLSDTFKNLRGKGKLSEADIDATGREIRLALLEADVALPVVKDFVASVKERARGTEVSQALNPAQQVIKIVNEELVGILGGETRRLRFAKTPPTVIMLAGLQGSGKTTLAAKLALWLKEQGKSPMLVAADLQRPNAVKQLQVMGERAGVTVHAPEPGNGVGDPVAVSRGAIEEAKRTLHDVVIVDTAGRLGIDEELMREAANIRDAVTPDEVLFVVDAMIGQDAVNTAQAFLDGVGYDGVVLTKLDGDARGGAALSIAKMTGKPVMFASNGEKLSDFDLFHPDRMASRILDMGDLLTLIEQAEKTFDADQAAKSAAKLQDGDFTLDDFLEQMQQVRKMGSLSKMLGMLPGMGQFRDQLENFDEREIDRIQAIIHIWISTAHLAEWGLFLLRTDPEAIERGAKHEGITAFIIDMETPGIECRPIRDIVGDAMFNEVWFTDARIPASEPARRGGPGLAGRDGHARPRAGRHGRPRHHDGRRPAVDDLGGAGGEPRRARRPRDPRAHRAGVHRHRVHEAPQLPGAHEDHQGPEELARGAAGEAAVELPRADARRARGRPARPVRPPAARRTRRHRRRHVGPPLLVPALHDDRRRRDRGAEEHHRRPRAPAPQVAEARRARR